MDLEDERFGDGAKGPQNGRGNEQRKDELTYEAPHAPNAAPRLAHFRARGGYLSALAWATLREPR